MEECEYRYGSISETYTHIKLLTGGRVSHRLGYENDEDDMQVEHSLSPNTRKRTTPSPAMELAAKTRRPSTDSNVHDGSVRQ